jgi:hypothetical protein
VTTSALAETPVLQSLRADFEAKGYTFITDPSGDQLPEFLRAYRPDALAIGQHDKVIIEVQQQGARGPKVPLTRLSETTSSHTGWRYLLVYRGQDPSEIIELSRPQKFQIDAAIREGQALEHNGHTRAAMIEGWSVLEALARRLYPEDIRISLRPLSSMQVIERLAMDGQISDDEAKRLRVLSAVRNALVHGDLNVSVASEDVRYVLTTAEAINKRLDA